MRKIRYERVHPLAKAPTKAYQKDACWDLYSVEEVTILPFTTKAIDTGLRFDIWEGEKLHIYSRSGLAAKNTICVFNAPGVIDSGYVNTLAVILYNGGKEPFNVKVGMKIAQFCREKVLDDDLFEGVVDTNTERGENGLGSSGL